MDQLLYYFLYAQIALCFFCLYRIIRGPTIADRMVGIDIFGILVVGICAILAVITDRMFIIDIGIAWIILSFIGTLTGKENTADRIFGTAATVALCVAAGVSIVRVHDVAQMLDVIKVTRAIKSAKCFK